ncbi:unnamed protein product (mitochondrion) [Plasmodiophora brassicae]|uniref:Uncharacterized protein n=1 Tax=Plasmodiophora brassicae TaxID=37360 RepID=A0A0G4IT95_PLABS|nr:hypothetical protein PBRA_006430 [Plasmodiophora brassicae]SPQ94402.1 unnamed protein product [Plasmodiophora brassicae]
MEALLGIPPPTTSPPQLQCTIRNALPDLQQCPRIAFPHAVQMIAPVPHYPADVHENDDTFYYHAQLPLSVLIAAQFLDEYVRRGTLVAISHPAAIDHGNVVAVAPGGRLLLSVDEATFTTVGLPGRRSRSHPDRYDISIDIGAESFRPGKPLYTRVQWCLKHRYPDPIGLLLSYAVDGRCSPISLPDGYSAVRLPASTRVSSSAYNGVPDALLLPSSAISSDCLADLSDWIGHVTLGVGTAHDTGASGQCATLKQVGLLPPDLLLRRLADGRALVDSGLCDWAIVSAIGFEDAPVSWITSRGGPLAIHSYEYAGDHHCTIVIRRRDPSCIIMQGSAAHDQYK